MTPLILFHVINFERLFYETIFTSLSSNPVRILRRLLAVFIGSLGMSSFFGFCCIFCFLRKTDSSKSLSLSSDKGFIPSSVTKNVYFLCYYSGTCLMLCMYFFVVVVVTGLVMIILCANFISCTCLPQL